MPITPTVEERTGYGRGARGAARLARHLVRPLVARLPWTPLALRLAGLIEFGGALLRPPRGTAVVKVRGLGCAAEWVRCPGVTGSRDGTILYFHGGELPPARRTA
ncbi:hypothetical protein [Actinocorallia aurea]